MPAMSYTIDERNPERQQLLAEMLNPTTREVLARLPRIPDRKVLDLGCGQGNTTRTLAEAQRAPAHMRSAKSPPSAQGPHQIEPNLMVTRARPIFNSPFRV